jgi:hypothetical protein
MLLDLKTDLANRKEFGYDLLASAAIMGTVSGVLGAYDTTKTYNAGDKIPYVTNSGELIIIVCINNAVTGDFNPANWEEWNIMDELQGLYDDYIVASWNVPSLRRNKVWLAIKDESISVAREAFGGTDGIIVYNNFIIQLRQPTMNVNTIWGKITSVLDEEVIDYPIPDPNPPVDPEEPVEPEPEDPDTPVEPDEPDPDTPVEPTEPETEPQEEENP